MLYFNDTATTEIYTLSLHDALPVWIRPHPVRPRSAERDTARLAQHRTGRPAAPALARQHQVTELPPPAPDRKSTRLNSSHANISYAVFCLKKKASLAPSHPRTPLTP